MNERRSRSECNVRGEREMNVKRKDIERDVNLKRKRK